MLTIAFSVYFLFGALLPVIGPTDQVEYSLAYYPVTAVEALRVDAVNGIGLGLALVMGSLSLGHLLVDASRRVSTLTSRLGPRSAITILLAIGGLSFAYVAGTDLGLRTGLVSGIWRLLAKLLLVAIFLGGAYRGRGERSMLAVTILFTLLHTTTGILHFNKSVALLPLAALVGGLSLRYRNRYLLPVGLGVVALLFVSLGSLASFGRNSLPEQFSGKEAVELRLAALDRGLALAGDPTFRSAYHPWSRLSYLPAQAAGMDFFESGRGGQDIRMIPWLFVPRIIAPQKPSITQTSADLHTKITGNEGSSTGQGIFVSAYYNAGWLGLVLIAAICGWILSEMSAMARVIVKRRDVLLFPFALLGVYMAFRIDGHFISDYFGTFVYVLYLIGGGSIIVAFLTRRRFRTA